ncbi:PREDICTED: myoneurin-like isoform X2 [Nicrophorus vespilloides]|uniref:Myoneurin-like isoform X2 n=1 Tax=Nicrophorus vespilloides TaxID=110193 RepID=A0ABM1MJL7_NICVS|nr:PREDICTED: myoneurin-like isoform X2 [Nicrophorus vespilloides]
MLRFAREFAKLVLIMSNSADFCYICFDSNKGCKDYLKVDEECQSIVQKLKSFVSEVDWSANKRLLLCEKCVKKLNQALEFRKQCVQSSAALTVYLVEIEKAKEKKAAAVAAKKEDPIVLQYLNLLKNDKVASKKTVTGVKVVTSEPQIYPAITKIILTNQANSFQNVFVNLLPSNVISTKTPIVPQVIITPPNDTKKPEPDEVSKLLNDTKTEEVSVEVDPLDFNMESEKTTESKPAPPPLQQPNNFRPILPKLSENYNYTNEEKMEFFNSGHFLFQGADKSQYYCEKCMIQFESLKVLNNHIKQVHSSQYPYKCDLCSAEFATKESYKSHTSQHSIESELVTNSITLTDFATNSPKINDLMPPIDVKPEPQTEEEIKCDKCDRSFGSNQGLIRHQAKQHKSSTNRKKYFIKGMKNAKCDICNRMFSTTSYLNLHRKLHDRKGEWRRKIFKPEIEPLKTQVIDMIDKLGYDHSDIDDDDDGTDMMCIDNVSAYLETSMREPAMELRIKQVDNG